MSKKRGLSLEDKRKVILSIYHDQKEPFNLKEIETIGSRMGVVQQTIKEVNQSLVDDFMVNSDKIGAANFFWSFPSKCSEDLKRKREDLTSMLNASSGLDEKLSELLKDRCSEDREQKLAKLNELIEREINCDKQILSNKECDPEEVKRIQKLVSSNKTQINRWTDNVWTVKKYLTKSKGMNGKDADKLLKIDANFDYV